MEYSPTWAETALGLGSGEKLESGVNNGLGNPSQAVCIARQIPKRCNHADFVGYSLSRFLRSCNCNSSRVSQVRASASWSSVVVNS